MKVKYIKSHAQRLVTDLCAKWDDEVALELAETLSDYVELMTGGKEKEEAAKPVEKKVAAPKRKYGLRDCPSNDTYKKIFDLATEASRLGHNNIFITPASMGLEAPKLYSMIANINTSKYKMTHHPNCRVKYRTVDNGYQLTFTRKDATA